MSVAGRLGLPEAFQATVLVLVVAFALAPYFSGMTVGGVVIPRLDRRRRRTLRIAGPVAVAVAIALVVPMAGLQPRTTDLHLLAAGLTEEGDVDAVVSNSGTTAALITGIELEVVRDYNIMGRPPLASSGTYVVPVGALPAGGRRKLMVRHLVPPAGTERIIISPSTARSLTLRLHLHGADGTVLTREIAARFR